jgi:hypothetical protein
MRYDNFGPGEDGYDNDDHEYDSDRDAQDSYDDYREQNALDRELGGKRIRFVRVASSPLGFRELILAK